MDNSGVSIVLPNGSLEEPTRALFRDAGLEVISEDRSHVARIESGLINRVVIARPQHIPDRVAGGQFDLGICGLDCVVESGVDVATVMDLPYSKKTSQPVRVVLFAHEGCETRTISDVPNEAVILSEYPQLTKRILQDKGIGASVKFSYGSTEAWVPDPYQYGVCVTETGSSLKRNRLRIIETLLVSPTVMIANQASMSRFGDTIVQAIRRLLSGVIIGRNFTMLTMNVPTTRLDSILRLIPSQRSPTVNRLASDEWCSVQSVVPRYLASELMLRLLSSGAEDIIETPIIRMARVRD